MDQQPSLFSYRNPLLERLGAAFFSAASKQSGVYLMKDSCGALLYVGKAKNLRARLNSYKRARPGNVSRKVLRLLRLTRAIEVRVCKSEKDALLTENHLLRTERPPFNVVNTSPETYYFIRLKRLAEDAKRTRLELTTNPDPRGGSVYGVFKGRGLTRDGFQSLLRLLSARDARDEHFYFPPQLMKYRPPPHYTVELDPILGRALRKFLNGRSRSFLDTLFGRLLANESIPRFIHRVIEEDLRTLEEFYLSGPRRVCRLKRRHGIRRRAIAQSEIDDLLVISR